MDIHIHTYAYTCEKIFKNYLLKIQNLHYSVGEYKHNVIEQNLRTCTPHEAGEGQLTISLAWQSLKTTILLSASVSLGI